MSDTNTRAPTAPAPPSRPKLAVVTWIVVYPIVTVLLGVIGPGTATWPLPLRTLVLTALMVPLMTWLVIPLVTRLFRGWLSPGPSTAPMTRGMTRLTERT